MEELPYFSEKICTSYKLDGYLEKNVLQLYCSSQKALSLYK